MSQLQVTGEAKVRDIQGPVVANSGVITALDGDASQYVRGDGTLADFPTSTGGGSSVSYYLNSSVSQGTIGGVAYRQLGKTPIIGAGTDITISANGYVASYITDANDPALLEVPAGNFNCEFYFSVNSNNHNPFVYAEVYKYDGTTFTLIGTSVGVPEYLSNGTTLSPYYFAIPVSQTVLTITDRIAIRIYVNVDGRVVTLHTENNHLCQVITTFSKGLTSLNNLTRQVQFLATGTSGTDFNISSVTATHTFNLPIASATNTGKLSSTDWSTFNNKQAALTFTAPLDNTSNTISIPAASASVDGYLDNLDWTKFNTAYNDSIISAAVTGTTTKTLTLNQQDGGTITASWTDDNTDAVTSVFGRTGAVVAVSGDYNTSQVTENTNLYFTDARARAAISLTTTGSSGASTYNNTTGILNVPTYTLAGLGGVPTSRTLSINGETYDLSANRSWTITAGISGSGAAGRVAYWNGTTSITSEAAFNYDDNLNRFGVNTNSPNATIGANANLDSGYSLLLKNSDTNYSGIGFSTSSTYGNTIETVRIGSAPSRNLTLYNYAGYISITENGSLGIGILTPNNGIDIYNSTQSQLWLHNNASGLTSTDGVRLALFNNLSANLRNFDGGLSLTAEGDFQIITIGAENLRVNSANGFIGIGNPASLPSMLTVNGGATISGLTTGQVLFPTSGGTLSGTNSLFWDNATDSLRIGSNTSANRRLSIFSSSDANHFALISNAPAITLSNNFSYTYYATLGMATANNNFVAGTVAGDLVLGAFNTNSIIFSNANTNTQRMKLTSGGDLVIGATSADTKLDVRGEISLSYSASNGLRFYNQDRSNWSSIGNDTATGTSNANLVFRTSAGTALTIAANRNTTFTTAATFSSNVGINGGSTNFPLVVKVATNQNLRVSTETHTSVQAVNDAVNAFVTLKVDGSPLLLNTQSGGNVGIGTSSPNRTLEILNPSTQLRLSYDASTFSEMRCDSSGGLLVSAANSYMIFYTNSTERMRITSGGYLKASNTGNYSFTSATGPHYDFFSNDASNTVMHMASSSTSYSGVVLATGCGRTANAAYSLFRGYSGDGGTGLFNDKEFDLYGDGNGKCDGSWTGGGADYAEYFEWADGNINNEDRRGYSVSLVDNKIKIAEQGENIIGVISGNPSIVGDAAWNKWSGKHLKDDFGSYILDEDGNRILNPIYDKNVEYIPREQRPEWSVVGLMGKLRIRKGQATMPTWIKMRDVSENVEEWLIK